jgi:hypothetical protein
MTEERKPVPSGDGRTLLLVFGAQVVVMVSLALAFKFLVLG